MIRLRKGVSLLLLIFTVVCILSGCAKLPEDDIEVRVVTAEKTYLRDENATELFFLFDVLNGKDRTIQKMEIDVAIKFRDGSQKTHTINYDEPVPYSGSYPAIVRYTVEGRADSIEILAYRFDVMDYWQTFGSYIIWTILIYIVIAVVMVALAMAEMEAPLSIISVLLIAYCIINVLFSPFAASIYVIIGTVIAFVPFIVFKLMDY